MRRLALVGDEGLVDVEELLVGDKRLAPSLGVGGQRVGGLDANEKAALEVEDKADVEEDLVNDVAGNYSFLLQCLLQIVQVFQVLDIFALGIHEFFDDMVSVGHFGGAVGASGLAIGIDLLLEKVSAPLCKVKDVINDLGNLMYALEICFTPHLN